MPDLVPLTLPELTEHVKEALQQWHKPYRARSPLTQLLLFQKINGVAEDDPRRSLNQLLLDGMADFDPKNGELVDLLQMRFADDISVQETAMRFSMAEGTVQKKQRLGWEELAQILHEKEMTLRQRFHEQLLARLESPTYSQLFGVDAHLQTLTNLLTDPDGPQMIAIEGMGGIGKTSLTDALMRHLIASSIVGSEPFRSCAWVTARNNLLTVGGIQKSLPQASLTGTGLLNELATQLFADEGRPIGLDSDQLRSIIKHRLADQPHLIVVDNLETVADADILIDTLRQLVNPTRFLLTTRHNLFDQPDIYHLSIGELTEKDSLALVRYEAKRRNLQVLATAADDDLHAIYKTVGGNPLALRLIVGQTHVHALHDVLTDLAEARGKPIENLYTYIYWNAWHRLDEAAREAWLLMPLVNGSGMSVIQLAEFSEMPASDLRYALNQLVTLNLIEHRGDLQESRYFIHSLTRSFLQGQVLKWGRDDEDEGMMKIRG